MGYANALENPSFETNTTPTNMLGNDGNPSSNTPGWKTTEAENTIEVLSTDHPNSGFLHSHEFTADDGKWFAEINAKSASALYQDVLTTPGQTMNWQFAHRARTGAGNPQVGDSDTMALIIAPLEFSEGITTDSQLKALNNGLNSGAGHSFRISSTDAYNRYTVKSVTQDSQGSTYVVHDNTTNKDYSIYKVEDTSTITQGSYTETYTDWWGRTQTRTVNYLSSSWNRRSGSITVPEGQYTSRFFFMAVSSAVKDGNGGDSIGNFVDNTWFSQDPLPPASGTVRITVEKVVKGLSQADANAFFTAHASDLISQTVYDGKTASGTGTAETVTLTGVTAVDGGYKATYTKTYEDVETGSSKTFVTSENAGNVSVTGYDLKSTTVTDSNNDKASNNSIATTVTSGNSDTSSATVTITNEYTPSNRTLTLTKVVDKGNANKEFTFTVSAKKGDADVALTVPDGGSATVANGVVTAELHSQESATITVPYGATVSIAETGRDGYTTKYTVGDGVATASADGKCTVSDMTADTTVTATNTIKPVELTIRKEITGAQADLTKGYTFTVAKDGGGSYTTGELHDRKGESGTGDSVTLGGASATGLELNWGDKVTVTETDNTGYTTTYQVTVGSGDATSGNGKATSQIALDADSTTVVFTNQKVSTPVTAVLTGGTPAALGLVAIAGLAIAGGFALARRNAAQAAASAPAHMAGRRKRR